MTNELDVLIIRSLSELNDAATRLDGLDDEICREIDAEIQLWIERNGWKGAANQFGDDDEGTWLAPEDWIVPNETEDDAYLYFSLYYTAADPEDKSKLASFTGVGRSQWGFWLDSDRIKPQALKKLWKAQLKSASGLPLLGSDFFFPINLDQETLATAVSNGSIAEAFDPLRASLDRLPELASRLGSLKQAIVAAAGDVSAPEA